MLTAKLIATDFGVVEERGEIEYRNVVGVGAENKSLDRAHSFVRRTRDRYGSADYSKLKAQCGTGNPWHYFPIT